MPMCTMDKDVLLCLFLTKEELRDLKRIKFVQVKHLYKVSQAIHIL